MTANLDAILQLEAPIIVEIGSRDLPVEAILSLAPGSIIELTKGMDEELEIKVNNHAIGLGHAVKVGENFGVRVGFVGDVVARIRALAENTASGDSDDEDPEDLAAAMLAGQV